MVQRHDGACECIRVAVRDRGITKRAHTRLPAGNQAGDARSVPGAIFEVEPNESTERARTAELEGRHCRRPAGRENALGREGAEAAS
jgi:hypothetical protein